MHVLDLVSVVYGRQGTVKGWKDLRRLRWGLWRPWLKVKYTPRRLWNRWQVWRVPDSSVTPPAEHPMAVSRENDIYGFIERISVTLSDPVSFLDLDCWATDKRDAVFFGQPKACHYTFFNDELIEWLEETLDQAKPTLTAPTTRRSRDPFIGELAADAG